MTQQTFAEWLQVQRRLAGYRTQQSLADAAGLSSRTIRNYETGRNDPEPANRAILERLLGAYQAGDPVEVAVRNSELVEWRQLDVLKVYQRNLHEQRIEQVG